jgi:hypothetical protein
MRLLLVLGALIFIEVQSAAAQVIQQTGARLMDQWVFGVAGFGGIPVGEFRKHENGGGGFEVMTGFQPFRRQPLVLRLHVGGLIYGKIDRDIEEDYCDITGCYTETVYYDSRQHSMFYWQAGPELMFTNGKWRPFAYATAGLTSFTSQAALGYPSLAGSEPTQTVFWANNFSTSYGAGVRLVNPRDGRPTGFEFSTHFTRNAKARYLTERGLSRQSDGSWVVNPQSGAANVLAIKLALWIGPHVRWFER